MSRSTINRLRDAFERVPWRRLWPVPAAFLLWVVDVWCLGTFAASLAALARYPQTGVWDKGFASWCWHNPFGAAVLWLSPSRLPEGVFSAWLGVNAFLAVAAVAAYFFLKERGWVPGLLGERRPSFSDDPSKGTAGWLKPSEAGFLRFSHGPGLLFGAVPGVLRRPAVLPPDAPYNRNVAVFGSPGSMKSRAYVRNNLFQAVVTGNSVIVTDPKGELTRDFAGWFREQGYHVRIFNLVGMAHSDRWNVLSDVRDDIDAQLMADVVIANTQVPGRRAGDPFWDRAEQNLLKALALFAVEEFVAPERNLGAVYTKLLATGDSRSLDRFFGGLRHDHPARLPYNLFRESDDKVRSGIINGLGTRLQVFQNRLVRELTAESDIDLELPGRERCAYFCVVSDVDSTFHFLASLFFSFLFIRLVRLADRSGGPLPVPVHFLLDEFCNIGTIPDFTKKISTMRSRGIFCSVIFQNIGQLKERYPNDAWQEILGDCDFHLFLGANDPLTAEYVSRTLGSGTVETLSRTREAGLEGLWDPGRVTTRPEGRPLLMLDEVLRFPRRLCILRASGSRPLVLEKMDYTRHPRAKGLRPEPVTSYCPAWSLPFRRDVQGAASVSEMPGGESGGAGVPAVSGSGTAPGGGARAAVPDASGRAASSPSAGPRRSNFWSA